MITIHMSSERGWVMAGHVCDGLGDRGEGMVGHVSDNIARNRIIGFTG